MNDVGDFCQAVSRVQFRGCDGEGNLALPDGAPSQVPEGWPEFKGEEIRFSSEYVPLTGYFFESEEEYATVYPIPGIPGLVLNNDYPRGPDLWLFFTEDGDCLPVAFARETGEGVIPKRDGDSFNHVEGKKIPVMWDDESGQYVVTE